MEACNILDVIDVFVKLCGNEIRRYFFLDNGEPNGATFVTVNGKLFAIYQAAKLSLRDGDIIFFGQVIDGG